MPAIINPEHSPEYASSLNEVGFKGTRMLAVRDVPKLVRKYVKGTDALDYGCGPGNSTVFVQSLGLQADGADINEDMLKLAKQKLPKNNFHLIKEDGRIPAEDGRYDLVFTCLVLAEISTEAELGQAVAEIYRVLKPSGTAITVVGTDHYYQGKWFSMNVDYEMNKHLKSGGVVTVSYQEMGGFCADHYFWSDDDYKKAIKNAGFTIVHTEEPLGKDDDGYPWQDEKKKSAYRIYVTQKGTQS